MSRVFCTMALILGATALTGLQTAKADLAQLDSSAFTYKYEMDVDPSTQDLAGTPSGADWAVTGTAGTLSTLDDGSTILALPCAGSNYYSATGTAVAGAISKASDLTYANGFSIEFRGKSANVAKNYSMIMEFGESSSSQDAINALIGNSYMSMSTTSGQITLGADNGADYHVFRYVHLANSNNWKVYRDGTEMFSDYTPTGVWADGQYWTMGGGSSSCDGTFLMDYFRVTSGAFAPTVPEPGTSVLLSTGILGLLAYAWRKRR